MNIPFQQSAQFYEIIYQNKDYQQEAEYLYSLLQHLNISVKGKLLDIGCGTGSYIPWHLKRRFEVTGLDISEEMLAIAKKKFPSVNFITGDVGQVAIQKKFDIAFMMFHVINYQTSNEKLISAFQNISKHLEKGGVLVFDYWHGSAIEIDLPRIVERSFENNSIKIIRRTTPKIDTQKHLVDVCFDYTIIENSNQISKFQEHHLMRYLFVEQITKLLKNAGFEVCLNNGWLKNSPITVKDWYGIVIARKI